jgi:predicted O-methyltransferase YrrM
MLKEFVDSNSYFNDKGMLGYIDQFYDPLFSPKKDTTLSLLEIGVAFGGSIRMWRDYFTNAVITGIDPFVDFPKEERTVFLKIDAYTQSTVDMFQDGSFDIVIDDGPHSFDSMVYFLQNYLPKVKSGGILILEDIHNTSWTPKLLNLIDPAVGKISVVDMRNKQTTEQLLGLWKNGLDVIIVEKH